MKLCEEQCAKLAKNVAVITMMANITTKKIRKTVQRIRKRLEAGLNGEHTGY